MISEQEGEKEREMGLLSSDPLPRAGSSRSPKARPPALPPGFSCGLEERMYSSCLWLSLVTLPDRLEGSWTGNRQQALSYGVLDPQHQRNPLKTRRSLL